MNTEARLPVPSDEQVFRSVAEREQCWRRRVEQWRQSGLSQAEFVRQHQLVMSQFSYWKRKFERAAEPNSSAFVAVNAAATLPVRLHHPNGLIVECVPGADVTWLRELMGM
jgi:hypothetical protein|tara:strand:- start:2051 stop:2383 length:333 start_codon:yes stop_codon:yes gene_type:complete